MFWTNVKTYLYSAVAFLIAMLSGYAMYQKNKADNLEDDLDTAEKNLKGAEAQGKEKDEARKEEQKQNDNVKESEKEKAESSTKIDDILDRSETEDVHINL